MTALTENSISAKLAIGTIVLSDAFVGQPIVRLVANDVGATQQDFKQSAITRKLITANVSEDTVELWLLSLTAATVAKVHTFYDQSGKANNLVPATLDQPTIADLNDVAGQISGFVIPVGGIPLDSSLITIRNCTAITASNATSKATAAILGSNTPNRLYLRNDAASFSAQIGDSALMTETGGQFFDRFDTVICSVRERSGTTSGMFNAHGFGITGTNTLSGNPTTLVLGSDSAANDFDGRIAAVILVDSALNDPTLRATHRSLMRDVGVLDTQQVDTLTAASGLDGAKVLGGTSDHFAVCQENGEVYWYKTGNEEYSKFYSRLLLNGDSFNELGGSGGTLIGAPSFITGQSGQGLSFNGTTQRLEAYPHGNDNFEVPGGFTNTGLAYDPETNTFWVGDFTNSKIVEVNRNGTATGREIALGFQPQGVAIDVNDHIWVSDHAGERLVEYDRPLLVATGNTIATTGFRPNGLTHNATTDELIYVRATLASAGTNVIARHDPGNGDLLGTVTLAGAVQCDGLAWDDTESEYLTTDDTGDLLFRHSNTGTLIETHAIASSVEDITLVGSDVYYCSDAEFHDSFPHGNRIIKLQTTGLAYSMGCYLLPGTIAGTSVVMSLGNPVLDAGIALFVLAGGGSLRIWAKSIGVAAVFQDTVVDLSDWKHVAVVVDPVAKTMELYLDGVLADTMSLATLDMRKMYRIFRLDVAAAPTDDAPRFADIDVDNVTAGPYVWGAAELAIAREDRFTKQTVRGTSVIGATCQGVKWWFLSGQWNIAVLDQAKGEIRLYTPDTPGDLLVTTWTETVVHTGRLNLQDAQAWDIDGDGELELVYTWEGNAASTGGVHALSWDGVGPLTSAGSFSDHTLATVEGAGWLHTDRGDWAGNGRNDILFTARGTAKNAASVSGVYYLAEPAMSPLTSTWTKTSIYTDVAADILHLAVGNFRGNANDIAFNSLTPGNQFNFLDAGSSWASTAVTVPDVSGANYNLVKLAYQVTGRDALLISGDSSTSVWEWDGAAYVQQSRSLGTKKIDGRILSSHVDSTEAQELIVVDSVENTFGLLEWPRNVAAPTTSSATPIPWEMRSVKKILRSLIVN